MRFSTLTGTVAVSAAGVFAREMAVDEARAASELTRDIRELENAGR